MIREFIIRPKPFQDESLKSYLIRIADANKSKSVCHVYRIVGLNYGSWPTNLNMITKLDIPLEQISRFTTISKSDLISLTFFDVFGKFLNTRTNEVNTIFRFGMKTKFDQVCPLCLKEKQYIRKRWSIGFYTCCHLHNCLMINKCPGCKKNIRASMTAIVKCKCGYDLQSSPITFVSKNETKLSKLISDKLQCNDGTNDISNNIFERMDLLSTIYTILLFIMMVFKYEHNEKFSFGTNSISRIHEKSNYIYSIFFDWPHSFHKFVDKIREIPKKQNYSHGMTNDFGEFYKIFFNQLKGYEYQELREQFESYLFIKWNEGYMYDRFVKKLIMEENRIYLTGEEASTELNVHYSTVIDLLNEQKIEGKLLEGKYRQVLIRKASIEKYKYEKSRVISLAEVANTLGISRRLARILIVDGIITAISGPELNNEKKWNIHKKSVEDLIEAFSSNQVFEEYDIDKYITFKEVLRLFKGISAVNFFRNILDKKIITLKLDKRNTLNSFALLKKDVYSLHDEHVSKHVIYTHEIAREFGVNQYCVFEWINKGLLDTEEIESVYVIRPNSFFEFKNKYISLFQITKNLVKKEKEYHKSTIKTLMKHGIFPIHTHNNNYLSSLFHKEDITQFLNDKKNQVYYTLEETSKILQMSLANIYKLVERGVLEELRINKCRLIHIKSIQTFQRNFIWISRISELIDLPDSYIYKYLSTNDVHPYGEIDIKPFIYERKKVTSCFDNNAIRGKYININILEKV